MTNASTLTEMTPVEIDTVLSDLWNQEEQAEARLLSLATSLHEEVGDKPGRVRGARGPIFSLSWERVLEQAIVKSLAPHTETESYTARRISDLLRNWAMTSRKLADIAAEIKPYTDEYARRGGWNRVFLAQSHDGHAHNGTECSTCHHGVERTQFAWLIKYSGKTEAEIVADAGWRACTTCYPSAPVGDPESLPTKMFTPDEEKQARAREERAAAQAQRAADKAAKGITHPDGSPLRDRHGSVIKTERTAVIEATNELSERYKNLRTDQIIEADAGLTPFFYEKDKRTRLEAEARGRALPLIEAIAHKRGESFETVLAELETKALAKAKRDMGGDWAQHFCRNATWQQREYDAYKAACETEGREPFEALSLRWPKF